jgi:hypothetical protein
MERINNQLQPSRCAAVANPRLISATDISKLFVKPEDWFSRDRVRKALYARGFPAPIIRGRWLRSAVETWMEKNGTRSQQPSRHIDGDKRFVKRASFD